MTWPEAFQVSMYYLANAGGIVGCAWAFANMWKWWRKTGGRGPTL